MIHAPFSRRAFVRAAALATAGPLAVLRGAQPAADEGLRVVCAGANEVFVLDLAAAERGTVRKVWAWTAADAAGLPEERHRLFRNLDECKPVDGGRQLLVCASNGGCGLIDRATKRLAWSASVTNAHSVELLPAGRIAAASSLGGDHLVLFDPAGRVPGEPVWRTPLRSAHGLVWDDRRRVLWALGYDELRRYELKDWSTATPSLTRMATHHLPDPDGHDLRPVPGSDDLLVTTDKTVQLFDRGTARFRPHPAAGRLEHVKAVDVHPTTGRVVYSTWGQKVLLLGPEAEVPLRGSTVYKVRWFPPDPVRG